ncbi:Vesicle-fusing ATPase [Capsicum baccatum]|uniref:Vesicle-fusing ATPase n=1 Tax=Capsicum baccatum TaxID=33114 RepID=A0A2G2WKL4_CAPBA|nr:Vesicle-fusing ATPase [Capsicum baccatum]
MSSSRVQPLMNVVRVKGVPILQQLHLEERLLRTSSQNWCIVNDGTNEPTIVMGISGKPAELLEIGSVLKDKIPVIKRFTGGGTVIVDHQTVFVTFICNTDALPSVQPYPRPIMSWSGQLYSKVFQGVGDFSLRENDYVFDNRKFGGNAQSITKGRWVHHTSFLWDYEMENMAYLKLPKRAPDYRQARDHLDFICRMKDYISRQEFINRTISALGSQFSVTSMELESLDNPNDTKFAPSTRLLRKQELEECFESESGNVILQSLFIPPEDFNLALLILDLEFVKKGTKDEQVDAVSLANQVRKRFANQIMTIGQKVTFEYHGMQKSNIERGMVSADTCIMFEAANSSGIKIVNQREAASSSIFWQKEFNLQSLGIGGLGAEFSDIF